MRTLLVLALAALAVAPAVAQDLSDPKAVVARAVEAHGGAKNLARLKAGQSKEKGILHLPAVGAVEFTSESHVQLPDRLRNVMELKVMGRALNTTTVLFGDSVRMVVNGQEQPVGPDRVKSMKEEQGAENLLRALAADPRPYTLTALGESKVMGLPAVGVRVSARGQKDVSLYFDKDNGLLIKTLSQVKNDNGQEVTQEKYLTAYKEVSGLKSPGKVYIYRDGKKFLEMEVTELKLLEKLDDGVFK